MSSTAAASAGSLNAMRALAGFLLVAMSILYVVALLNHNASPAWGYARAFAEAAMVGGLADWFAVTAIFRHPLGLPIPHTAVIPNSKERIADALGEFVAVNFMAPHVVALRLQSQDLATALARQIVEPGAARKIADGLLDAVPSIMNLLDDEIVGDFLRRQLAEFTRDQRLAGAIGQGLKLLTDHGRHQPILDAALNEGWKAIEEHEPAIRAQVRARTNWMLRLISVDRRAADALIDAMEETLREIAHDPGHPARQRVTEVLQRLAHDLQHSPATRAQVEQLVLDMLNHPAVGAYFGDVWRALKEVVRTNAETPDSDVRRALADAIERLGAALLADQEVRDSLNLRLRALLAEVSGRHGRDVSRLISETIRSWDTKTVVEKLEQNVGADLQYIRINGTIIGGVVGLVIHQISLLLT